MATQYFKNFPLVNYNDKVIRNIMLKTNFLNEVFFTDTNFYTYEVQDGERPSTVAYNYYGSVDFTWLVLLSNKMLDPYFDWVLAEEEFNAYLSKKYGSVQDAMNTIVEYTDIAGGTITVDTYNYFKAISDQTMTNVTPVYAYDKELELNEQKRNIRLVDKVYAYDIAKELEKSFK